MFIGIPAYGGMTNTEPESVKVNPQRTFTDNTVHRDGQRVGKEGISTEDTTKRTNSN